jgi:molybdenum cofactor cytidylyltransferase
MIAAVVPAAGASTRMGSPKLLVELEGETVIERVVVALRGGGVERVVVVAPPVEATEGPAIAQAARAAGAEVVVPATRPPEMRESIELGLERLGEGQIPEHVMVTPADLPGITAAIVRRVLGHAASVPESLVIPRYLGKRGHPIVLPWRIALAVRSLPAGQGLNALVAQHAHLVTELAVDDTEIGRDLDTLEDLAYWRGSQSTHDESLAKMNVSVRLFALARERAGRSEVVIELPLGSTVADLRIALADQLPALRPLMPAIYVSVDEEYAGESTPILPGSRVALIPPVSGGGFDRRRRGRQQPSEPSCERLGQP